MPLILSGRYLPIKLLGRGGFGAAFLACDRYTPSKRLCVVKQFQPAGDLTAIQLDTAVELFEREARVLEELGSQHDQITELLAFFEIIVKDLQPGEQLFYLVQEYIDGENLEDELAQKSNFSEDEVLELLQNILPVLQFVHENHTIHRDIKPSNIMRRRDGKLFLLDFGAVKQVANAGSGAVASHSTGIYTPGFAPPEQMSGGQVSASTDLYALAVTALVLLTGEEPGVLFDDYNNCWSWRSHAPNVRSGFAYVLDRMLLSAPKQRFQLATEVLKALSQLQPAPSPAPVTMQHPPTVPSQPAFSTVKLLGGAAFSGFAGVLVAQVFSSLLNSPIAALGFPSVILTLLIFPQNRRWIETVDLLLIIAGTSVAIIFFVRFLEGNLPFASVFLMAVAGGLVAVALTALFRLIYKLLSLLLG
jgi:serine/threonine-protein kinase